MLTRGGKMFNKAQLDKIEELGFQYKADTFLFAVRDAAQSCEYLGNVPILSYRQTSPDDKFEENFVGLKSLMGNRIFVCERTRVAEESPFPLLDGMKLPNGVGFYTCPRMWIVESGQSFDEWVWERESEKHTETQSLEYSLLISLLRTHLRANRQGGIEKVFLLANYDIRESWTIL